MSVPTPIRHQETKPIVPHFRIVYRNRRGWKVAGFGSRVYVTFPGMEEIEFPGLRDIDVHLPMDGAINVTMNVVATTEVEWVDDE